MDSLLTSDSSIPSNIRFFLNYLFSDQLHEHSVSFNSTNLPSFSIPVAQQTNSVDCGVYMLNNVRKVLNMPEDFDISCNYNNEAKVRSEFAKLELGGKDVKSLRKRIAGAIDALSRTIGRDEFEDEDDDDSIEVVEVEATEEKRRKTPRKSSDSTMRGVVKKDLPSSAYTCSSDSEYNKSFGALMKPTGKKDVLLGLKTDTVVRKSMMAVEKPKRIPGIDKTTGSYRPINTLSHVCSNKGENNYTFTAALG